MRRLRAPLGATGQFLILFYDLGQAPGFGNGDLKTIDVKASFEEDPKKGTVPCPCSRVSAPRPVASGPICEQCQEQYQATPATTPPRDPTSGGKSRDVEHCLFQDLRWLLSAPFLPATSSSIGRHWFEERFENNRQSHRDGGRGQSAQPALMSGARTILRDNASSSLFEVRALGVKGG